MTIRRIPEGIGNLAHEICGRFLEDLREKCEMLPDADDNESEILLWKLCTLYVVTDYLCMFSDTGLPRARDDLIENIFFTMRQRSRSS